MEQIQTSPTGLRANLVLYGALFANLGIAVAKFVAAGISGSSSMATEGVHSLVDSANQGLLLYGQKRAARPRNTTHPFGYGRELYFWAFVVAILIFGVGAGVSVFEGISHVRAPAPLRDPTINYVVLGVAFVLEGASWALAMHQFTRQRAGASWWRAIVDSKDPATVIVLLEDSAALVGLLLAGAGIALSHWFGDSRIDGLASIAIGVVLGVVAAVLAREAKGLLIGESADPALIAQLHDLVAARPEITAVNHVRTLHTGPDAIFVAISADFVDGLTMGEGELAIEEMEAQLKAISPAITSIYIRPERVEDAVVLGDGPAGAG